MPNLDPIPTPAFTHTSTHLVDSRNPIGHMYNDPQGLQNNPPIPSTIGPQPNTGVHVLKKVLQEAAQKRKFGKLASAINMPKNMGKVIKVRHYLPLLDDRNLNDQGIDANGVQIRDGNLYGSSHDIGKITSLIPTLTEVGGRVNRVGFTRKEITGTFNRFGFFYEWTDEFANFDTDPSVLEHMYREAIIGAEQIQEDMLQIDLLNGAGTIVYAGTATSDDTMDATSVVTVQTLSRLQQALNKNRTPKSTKLITGSTMVDTRTATVYRLMFVPSELIPTLQQMLDSFGNPAFIPAHQYGAATKVMEDEVGIVGGFRIIEVEDMKRWEGAGAASDPAAGMYETNGKYDILPMLCLGDESFTTIGFQTSSQSKSTKFTILTKKPGKKTGNIDHYDVYGDIGITSIQWYYGILFLRPERIGLIKTVAKI